MRSRVIEAQSRGIMESVGFCAAGCVSRHITVLCYASFMLLSVQVRFEVHVSSLHVMGTNIGVNQAERFPCSGI